MTFNNINNGDPLDATKAMENWRNVNYGSALLPVNSSGSGVDDTIDLGSSSFGFKDGFFTGALTIGAQPYFLADSGSRSNTGNIDNLVEVENVGGFTLSSGKITISASGLYIISVDCIIAATGGFSGNVTLNHYNSSGTLLRAVQIGAGSTDQNSSQSGSITLRMSAGDYIYVAYVETAGTPSVSSVQVSILGWPS